MKVNKLPTIKEIAKRLKISTSTVSRALHNHPSIGWVTTMRVKQVAEELNYQPNLAAISFKKRKTFTIGVLLPNLSEAFFSAAISGIEAYANTKEYNVLMGQSLADPQREIRILESMKTHRVDGMIVSVNKYVDNYDHFKQLENYNIPIVFFDCIPDIKNIHYAACDLSPGMLKAIDVLVEKGIRNIALINGPEQLSASKQREQIYRQGLQQNGILFNAGLLQTSDLSKESTEEAMRKLLALDKPPMAIITFNDYLALDGIVIAKENNLVINKDIFFISFANLPIWAYMNDRPMGSIEQFPYKQGEKAAEILFSLLEESSEKLPLQPVYHQFTFDAELRIHTV
jgi:DNA-binding LacI/PurR family transcriptional regulator